MADENDSILPANGPDDTPHISWYCKHEKHDECAAKGRIAFHYRGQVPGPHPTHCVCQCHKATRSPKHDWTEYEDELDLERAISEVPPPWLVFAVSRKVPLPGRGKDAPWYYLGQWPSRSQTARYGRIVCNRCHPDIRTLAGTNVHVHCEEYTDSETGLVARVGSCFVCRAVFWFTVIP